MLFEAGVAEIEAAGTDPEPDAAGRRRHGMMVAFLDILPIRRRAFAALELGRSILRRENTLTIVLDKSLTKTGEHWEATVPKQVAEPLCRYLEETHPVLLALASRPRHRLWLDDEGEPFSGGGVTEHIGAVTTRLLGVRVTPHLFRDAAATTLAHISPDAARLTRAILGHTSYKTAEKHYNQARGVEVGRRHANLIEKLADELEPGQHRDKSCLSRKRK